MVNSKEYKDLKDFVESIDIYTYYQITIDIFERVKNILISEDIYSILDISAPLSYNLSILLEVMDKSLKDYSLLCNLNKLNNILTEKCRQEVLQEFLKNNKDELF